MKKIFEVEFQNIYENKDLLELIEKVVSSCFEEEKLNSTNMYLNIILTTPANIKKANKQFRNIDKETDVLSFPMFQKEELEDMVNECKEKPREIEDVIGDIIISIDRVKEQATEYAHSFERELAYMIVHGFYHIMGYDHMEEQDQKIMREKEEIILNKLNIKRD